MVGGSSFVCAPVAALHLSLKEAHGRKTVCFWAGAAVRLKPALNVPNWQR